VLASGIRLPAVHDEQHIGRQGSTATVACAKLLLGHPRRKWDTSNPLKVDIHARRPHGEVLGLSVLVRVVATLRVPHVTCRSPLVHFLSEAPRGTSSYILSAQARRQRHPARRILPSSSYESCPSMRFGGIDRMPAHLCVCVCVCVCVGWGEMERLVCAVIVQRNQKSLTQVRETTCVRVSSPRT
jgi:hypothetical protein